MASPNELNRTRPRDKVTSEEQAAIEKFMAEKGVTVCPAFERTPPEYSLQWVPELKKIVYVHTKTGGRLSRKDAMLMANPNQLTGAHADVSAGGTPKKNVRPRSSREAVQVRREQIAVMREQGYTQVQMAEKLGTTLNTIKNDCVVLTGGRGRGPK